MRLSRFIVRHKADRLGEALWERNRRVRKAVIQRTARQFQVSTHNGPQHLPADGENLRNYIIRR
jgi:hypothetical protein